MFYHFRKCKMVFVRCLLAVKGAATKTGQCLETRLHGIVSSQIRHSSGKYASLRNKNETPRIIYGLQKYYSTSTIPNKKDILSDGILSSGRQPLELKEKTYAEFIFPAFDRYSSHIALTDGITGRDVTFKELKEQVIRCASSLKRLGYGREDKLAIISPNNLDYVTLVVAAAACGIEFITFNPLSPPLELARQFQLVDSNIYVTIPELKKNIEEAINNSPNLQKTKKDIIVFGEAEECRPFSTLLEDDGSLFPSNQDIKPKDDTLQILFSSGTTGLPKAVELTHYGLVSNISACCEALLESMIKEGETVSYSILPFFHLYGQVCLIPVYLLLGVRSIIYPRFDPETFIMHMLKYQMDFIPLVPPLALFLAKTPLLDNKDVSFITSALCGAAPLRSDVTDQVLKRFKNAHLAQAYGMTESGVCYFDSDPCKIGTVGTLLANAKAKVVDTDTGVTLGPEQTGEIYLQSPYNMKCYKKNPDATKDLLTNDGWTKTGDIGMYDSDGYLTVTDRRKDIILYKGHNVSPAELESILIAHPQILDAAVIGVPDKDAGELPKAFVVKRDGQRIEEEEIHSYVKKYVSPIQYLRAGIEFVGEIPKTASGKILYRVLRDGQ